LLVEKNFSGAETTHAPPEPQARENGPNSAITMKSSAGYIRTRKGRELTDPRIQEQGCSQKKGGAVRIRALPR
jgi:hypothetical protein